MQTRYTKREDPETRALAEAEQITNLDYLTDRFGCKNSPHNVNYWNQVETGSKGTFVGICAGNELSLFQDESCNLH